MRIAALFSMVVLSFAMPGLAYAATFTVDSTADAVDADPGDGLCRTSAANCTLRAAIQEANALAGADEIDLPAGTYALLLLGSDEDAAATGDLDVLEDLIISGSGAGVTEITGPDVESGFDRVLHVDPLRAGVSAEVRDLTVSNGRTPDFSNGGGVATFGTLLLEDVVVRGNRAGSADSGTFGGGAHNEGSLTLRRVVLAGNEADDGAALFLEGGSETTISDSSIRDNAAGQSAGGVNNNGTLTISGTTFSGNSANRFNAGAIKQQGTMHLSNSTLSGNSAGGFGGAIEISSLVDPSTELVNVTVTGNSASEGGGLYLRSGAAITLTNTIVAGNSRDDCGGDDAAAGPGSGGGNLDGDGSCNLAAGTDQSDEDPLLGPLAGNGGPSDTHALQPGSPAIDAGDEAACPESDQRGEPRPLDGDGDGSAECDVGAFEAPLPPGTLSAQPGPNMPADPATALKGDSNVPVLQVRLGAQGEDLAVHSLNLTASGSGDDARDIAQVRVYQDTDGDGRVGAGEAALASGSYPTDEGQLTLALASPLAIADGGEAILLASYDIEPPLASRLLGGALAVTPLALLSLIAMLRGLRRRPLSLLTLVLLALLAGCPQQGGPADASYRATLTSIGASGQQSGAEVAASGLPIAGPEISVEP